MKTPTQWMSLLALATLGLTSCEPDRFSQPNEQAIDGKIQLDAAANEADALLGGAAVYTGTSKQSVASARVAPRFSRDQNVFIPSALAIDFGSRPSVTLPLYRGIGPSGNPTYFIITEAADFNVARILGVNYAPKLVFARDTDGSQDVTIQNGQIRFRGDVNFGPARVLAGTTFPPTTAQPGAVGDAEYSSIVVLPSGSVLNAQIVANGTGTHDRMISMNREQGWIQLEILDGFQGGDQFYYHLVTDASDPGPATIEKGVYAPRLANLPTFGLSMPEDESALLAFSPVANGETGATNPNRQGLNSTIVDNDRDPINVFPIDPDNNRRFNNNYSPLWDAHINMWTQAAIQAGKRRRIKSFEDLTALVRAGDVTNFVGNAGAPNGFVAGLKPTGALINCPVIAQPRVGNPQ
jgi:hypothetical protein